MTIAKSSYNKKKEKKNLKEVYEVTLIKTGNCVAPAGICDNENVNRYGLFIDRMK